MNEIRTRAAQFARAWQDEPGEDDDDVAEAGERRQRAVDVVLGVRADVPASARSVVPRDDYIASDDPRIPQLAPLLEVVGFGGSTSLDDEWD